MSSKSTDIRGVDYTISPDMVDVFHSPEDLGLEPSGELRLHGVEDSYLLMVRTDIKADILAYETMNNTTFEVNYWSIDRQKGILEDFNGNKWFYDSQEDLTAYFDENEGNYVAAHNPEIVRVWEDLMDGDWMDELEPPHRNNQKKDANGNMHRLHPSTRKRVKRSI